MSELALLSTKQVAALACVSHETVRRWAKDGRLKVAAKGPGDTGPLLFDPDTVDAFLAQRNEVAS